MEAFVTALGVIAVAELGDKTMLAAIGLAAHQGAVATWLGAVTALVAVNAGAVLAGRRLGARLPPHLVRAGTAALFTAVGGFLLGWRDSPDRRTGVTRSCCWMKR